MKNLLLLLVMITGITNLHGQTGGLASSFVLETEYGTNTVLTDSTWRVNCKHPFSQLGQGYLPTQIQPGYIAVDAYGRRYRVLSSAADYGTSVLDIVELQDNNLPPSGICVVYEPSQDNDLIPEGVVGNNGISPATAARIQHHNRLQSQGGVANSLYSGSGTVPDNTVARSDNLTFEGASNFNGDSTIIKKTNREVILQTVATLVRSFGRADVGLGLVELRAGLDAAITVSGNNAGTDSDIEMIADNYYFADADQNPFLVFDESGITFTDSVRFDLIRNAPSLATDANGKVIPGLSGGGGNGLYSGSGVVPNNTVATSENIDFRSVADVNGNSTSINKSGTAVNLESGQVKYALNSGNGVGFHALTTAGNTQLFLSGTDNDALSILSVQADDYTFSDASGQEYLNISPGIAQIWTDVEFKNYPDIQYVGTDAQGAFVAAPTPLDSVWMTYAPDTTFFTLHAIKDGTEFTHVVPMRESSGGGSVSSFWAQSGQGLIYEASTNEDSIKVADRLNGLLIETAPFFDTGEQYSGIKIVANSKTRSTQARQFWGIDIINNDNSANVNHGGVRVNLNHSAGASGSYTGSFVSEVQGRLRFGGVGIDLALLPTGLMSTSRDMTGGRVRILLPTGTTTAFNNKYYGYDVLVDASDAILNANESTVPSRAFGVRAAISTNPAQPTTGLLAAALYVENISKRTGFLDYGLYQEDTGVSNYFGGRLGIGTNAPEYTLHLGSSNSAIFLRPHDQTLVGQEGLLLADNSENRLMYHDGTSLRGLAFIEEISGTMSSFSLAADAGTPATISDANLVTIAGGTGIATAQAGGTVTANLAQGEVTVKSTAEGDQFLLIYDASDAQSWNLDIDVLAQYAIDQLPLENPTTYLRQTQQTGFGVASGFSNLAPAATTQGILRFDTSDDELKISNNNEYETIQTSRHIDRMYDQAHMDGVSLSLAEIALHQTVMMNRDSGDGANNTLTIPQGSSSYANNEITIISRDFATGASNVVNFSGTAAQDGASTVTTLTMGNFETITVRCVPYTSPSSYRWVITNRY